MPASQRTGLHLDLNEAELLDGHGKGIGGVNRCAS